MADLAGIGHVHLIVADHERAARFYGQAFGLREHFRVRDRLVFMVEALPARPANLMPGLPVDVEPLP